MSTLWRALALVGKQHKRAAKEPAIISTQPVKIKKNSSGSLARSARASHSCEWTGADGNGPRLWKRRGAAQRLSKVRATGEARGGRCQRPAGDEGGQRACCRPHRSMREQQRRATLPQAKARPPPQALRWDCSSIMISSASTFSPQKGGGVQASLAAESGVGRVTNFVRDPESHL